MANNSSNSKGTLQKLTFKILKATIKGVLFYAVYFVLWMFISPVSELIPGFQQMVEVFVIIYVFLIIVGELTSGTIFQHFFNAAKSLFTICYLILSLNGGMFGITFQNVNLMVDLRLFLIIAISLGLLGFAKSVLQGINYMSEKAEIARI